MRRVSSVLIWLALSVSGCADASPAATDHPVTTTTASPSPSEVPSPMPAATPPPTPAGSPVVAGWTGPVRAPSVTGAAMGADGSGGFGSEPEKGDAARAYADIERVSVDMPSQPHWRLALAAAPPSASSDDGAEIVISYGLAFETTGDGAPDYVVGLSAEGSGTGDYLVWVTDLATGATEEQDGPPYGFPVEFATPDEQDPGLGGPPTMLFTFLGNAPPGVTLSTPFYAWASVEEAGEVVAWDYAPNEGWIGAPPEAAATPEPVAAVPGVVSPLAPAGFPECAAAEFDFIGEGTLRGLGLDKATPVTPPDIDRVGMIWVTRDLLPRDFGPPGGPVEMTRMLCFEFPDGSGGSGWPVDAAWRPPPTEGPIASAEADEAGPSPALLALILLALVALGVSAIAFRSRR